MAGGDPGHSFAHKERANPRALSLAPAHREPAHSACAHRAGRRGRPVRAWRRAKRAGCSAHRGSGGAARAPQRGAAPGSMEQAGNRRRSRLATRPLGEHLVAVAAQRAQLEAIVGKAKRLATGGGDEAALGRLAFLVGGKRGKRLLLLRRPGQRRPQALAIDLEAAFVLVDELDGDLAGFGVAEERRGGERQHDAHLVVENVGAIAAERLVDRLLAGFVADDQAVLGVASGISSAAACSPHRHTRRACRRSWRRSGSPRAGHRSADELHLVDARAGLGVGGLRLPRSEHLGLEAVLLGGERARHGGRTQGCAGGKQQAEGAAARMQHHRSTCRHELRRCRGGLLAEAPPTARATLLAHQPCLAQTITTLMSLFSAAVHEASLAPGPTRKG